MNTDGGTLLIGVEGNGSGGGQIRGLREDLEHVSGDKDKLLLDLSNLISERFGHEVPRLIDQHMETVDGQVCWRVDVQPSRKGPVYVKWTGEQRFFVREGPKSKRAQDEGRSDLHREPMEVMGPRHCE